jgi:hypothetical protein
VFVGVEGWSGVSAVGVFRRVIHVYDEVHPEFERCHFSDLDPAYCLRHSCYNGDVFVADGVGARREAKEAAQAYRADTQFDLF